MSTLRENVAAMLNMRLRVQNRLIVALREIMERHATGVASRPTNIRVLEETKVPEFPQI